MKRTDFGKYMAQLRVMHNQTQSDMAEILSVSPAFLSKTESGKAKPISAWVYILSKNYGLSSEETEKLREIVQKERINESVYIKDLEVDDRNLVALLISKISHMSPDKKEKIKKLILE